MQHMSKCLLEFNMKLSLISYFSSESAAEGKSTEVKPHQETKKPSTSDVKKSSKERKLPEVDQKPKNDANNNRREERRPKKTASKKKSKLVNQHDDRVEAEPTTRTDSPKNDQRVTRSMAKKLPVESQQKIDDEPNRREQKSPKPQKKPKSELESMQDGLDRLVIVNRNAKSKSNRDLDKRESKRKSTDRKSAKLINDTTEKKVLKPGHSKWFPGDTRPDWTRPCFKDFDHVIIGDSQLKIYGQQQKQKLGYSITSFSGCDVSLELY